MPAVAPDELIDWLETLGLHPNHDSAVRFWKRLAHTSLGKHPAAKSHPHPMFLYGDDAEYTKYCDKLLGVYIGALQITVQTFFEAFDVYLRGVVYIYST